MSDKPDAADDGFELSKMRRFALAIGLVLLTYALAGVELKSPAEITPLGIPLVVKRANLLGIGLVLAALYAGTRYWFHAIVLTVSPMRARRLLRRGQYPFHAGLQTGIEFAEVIEKATNRYFPSVGGKAARLAFDFEIGTGFLTSGSSFKIEKVPYRNRVLAGLENLDYTAPVWLNVLAVAMYSGLWRWFR
jgi:hypothetical protein